MKSILIKFNLLLLLILLTQACQNEPVGDGLLSTTETIKKDDVLFHLLQEIAENEDDPLRSIVCIDFIYPFQLLVYNDNYQIINQVTMTGDDMFSDFLGNLPSNQFISISYPLQTTLADGSIFTVSNNTELKLAIDACSREDIIATCSGLFGNPQGSCVWKVPFIEGENNEFAGAVFTANDNGTINLYHLNNNYTGTWIFLFLNDELNLNINLAGTSTAATSWNLNYKVLSFTENLIKIKSNNIERTLTKDCKNSDSFEIGEIGPKGGKIAYKKNEYSNGWQYIEVLNQNFPTKEWGCINLNVNNAQFSNIGCGLQNNYNILNNHNDLNNFYTNPSICSAISNGTVASKEIINQNFNNSNNWFIPSFDELELIYNTLSIPHHLTFDNSYYWSSTEFDISKVKVINLQTGATENADKNSNNIKTLIIRYF